MVQLSGLKNEVSSKRTNITNDVEKFKKVRKRTMKQVLPTKSFL